MRELFVSDLIREVLGPREGIDEIIDKSPLNEYVTGVLAPVTNSIAPSIDDDAEIPMNDLESSEEDDDSDANPTPLFSPVLDPKNRPPSMGLSFAAEISSNSKIRICLTWARYFNIDDDSKKWQRKPRYSVLNLNLNSDDYVIYLDDRGEDVVHKEAEIALHVNIRPSKSYQKIVTLYLVNNISVGNGEIAVVEDHIFQPQIRVNCLENAKIVPGIKNSPQMEEDKKLEFIYRNSPIIARGHLCSAVWKKIDPENPLFKGKNLDFPECESDIPFIWSDGTLLDDEIRKEFSSPEVRTEFVPIYSIPSPNFEWNEEYGTPPVLEAEKLSEMSDPQTVNNYLYPLVEGYDSWIKDLKSYIDSFDKRYRATAQDIIDRCEDVVKRIASGINILSNREEARLAFCFANKAMDIQAQWSSRKSGLVYRPFQLAFILMNVESIVDNQSPDRKICDLLWIPTGGGKTEAYLAIVAFTLAYRRRRCLTGNEDDIGGAGVSVFTRYTLRLLTIQQYRRSLSLITACEYLRTKNILTKNSIGWRPFKCLDQKDYLWGSTPFSIGLWVGGGVTPNKLEDTKIIYKTIYGALSILKGKGNGGEPAQVMNCPACQSNLSIPNTGLQAGTHELHFVFKESRKINLHQFPHINLHGYVSENIKIVSHDICSLNPKAINRFYTLSIKFEVDEVLKDTDVDGLWESIVNFFNDNGCDVSLVSARPSRPGYFIRKYFYGNGNKIKDYNFEIICPNPDCPLHEPWCGGEPMGWVESAKASPSSIAPYSVAINSGHPQYNDYNRLVHVQEPFRNSGSPYISDRIPIPALTIDDQIYQKLPSMVVATVDKFARPPFEPRASGLFGNVEFHHCLHGYYRKHSHSQGNNSDHPSPKGKNQDLFIKKPSPLSPPDLIIQDELHLIEGPLGSLMGIYETAVDFLCREKTQAPVKYIASTATTRRANDQVKAIFQRDVQLFPPHGLEANKRFFVNERTSNPLEDNHAGRLYVGICAPGKGPLTPLVRLWSTLLQTAYDQKTHKNIDSYWTLTGYFNAIRELGGSRALYRQDIPQRMRNSFGSKSRKLSEEGAVELSGRKSSTELPAILDSLNRPYPAAPDTLFTTSMFGTGVDISRLGLMVVNGQPKTTSSYIQSTGRVGRKRGGLVVTFLRASRPRDLSHYELFCGYHGQLYRFVEPVTVYPFSPGALERALGPVGVFALRNMQNPTVNWYEPDSAFEMKNNRTHAPEILKLTAEIETRAQNQPSLRKPSSGYVKSEMNKMLDKWKILAEICQEDLKYVEYKTPPENPVVLGDLQHRHAKLEEVYENSPQSLRNIEETTGFQT